MDFSVNNNKKTSTSLHLTEISNIEYCLLNLNYYYLVATNHYVVL